MKIKIVKSGTAAKKVTCACDYMVDSPPMNK
jgi:hypothetical protein